MLRGFSRGFFSRAFFKMAAIRIIVQGIFISTPLAQKAGIRDKRGEIRAQ
jgi:hypothetical protein